MGKISDYPYIPQVNAEHYLVETENGTRSFFAHGPDGGILNYLTDKTTKIAATAFKGDGPIVDEMSDLHGDLKLLICNSNGNYAMSLDTIFWTFIDNVIPLEERRKILRGKNLGSVVTESQWTEIKNGTFKGLFLGDYWVISGIAWRIMDFDYWYGFGKTPCTTHHVVIMPDTNLGKFPMNDSPTTEGAYGGSKMRKTIIPNEIKPLVVGAFGDSHILRHLDYFISYAVQSTYDSPNYNWWNWGDHLDSDIEIPSEVQICGHHNYTAMNGNVSFSSPVENNMGQLSIFKIWPYLTHNGNIAYWLRDISSMTQFTCVSHYGWIGAPAANHTEMYVRPIFGICG